jgi:hypothetical protein
VITLLPPYKAFEPLLIEFYARACRSCILHIALHLMRE